MGPGTTSSDAYFAQAIARDEEERNVFDDGYADGQADVSTLLAGLARERASRAPQPPRIRERYFVPRQVLGAQNAQPVRNDPPPAPGMPGHSPWTFAVGVGVGGAIGVILGALLASLLRK